MAATIVLGAIGAGMAAWLLLFGGDTYATSIGEQRSLRLADGSTLEMNARSAIRVRLREHERDIELLAGQVLFRVAKDPSRPFIVTSGETRVRAVGTEFDVYRRKSGTSVTVIEGRVAVAPVADSHPTRPLEFPTLTVLSAGEQVTVSGAAPTPVHRANVAAVTAWTQRQIVFQGTPLTEVVEEFNRYNDRQMVLTDPSLEGIRVSGVFSSTEPASLLTFLSEQVGPSGHEATPRDSHLPEINFPTR